MGKNKENSKKTPAKIRGRKQTIKLRSNETIMDGDFVQSPFLAPYRGEPITYIEYQWETIENGVPVIRGIEVSGHGKLGVPTLQDKDVYRALQSIYIWSKVNDGVLSLEKDINKITEKDLIIDFQTIDNIAIEMGYEAKKISGQLRKRIKECIERLVATTIFNSENGGLYDAVNKKYITDRKATYRYLESMENYTVRDCENCDRHLGCDRTAKNCINPNNQIDVTQIKMSLHTYLNIANNYRLYYDRDNAKKIKNAISKEIYLISRKWIGNGYISKANIKKYMDRISINAKLEKHKKEKIKKAVENLNNYDFVEAYIEKDIVTVKHLDKKATDLIVDKKATVIDSSDYLTNKYVKYSEFIAGIDDLGLTEKEKDYYIDIQRISYLKALLRYVELKGHYNEELNKKDYFINCLKKNIELDKKYYDDK